MNVMRKIFTRSNLVLIFATSLIACNNESASSTAQTAETKEETSLTVIEEDSTETLIDNLNAVISQDKAALYFSDDAYILMSPIEIANDLKEDPEFEELNNELKCETITAIFRNTKCFSGKRKYLKEIVRRTGSGTFTIKKGELDISIPQSALFKSEVHRINLLIEAFFQNNINFCNRSEACQGILSAYICSDKKDETLRDSYVKCTDFITDKKSSAFLDVLQIISENIEKLQDRKISEEELKTIMNANLNKIDPKKDDSADKLKDTVVSN